MGDVVHGGLLNFRLVRPDPGKCYAVFREFDRPNTHWRARTWTRARPIGAVSVPWVLGLTPLGKFKPIIRHLCEQQQRYRSHRDFVPSIGDGLPVVTEIVITARFASTYFLFFRENESPSKSHDPFVLSASIRPSSLQRLKTKSKLHRNFRTNVFENAIDFLEKIIRETCFMFSSFHQDKRPTRRNGTLFICFEMILGQKSITGLLPENS